MFNHARSLLLNINGDSESQRQVYPGDELISREYREVPLPSYLQVIRQQLFGAMPDRAFLNYRVFQLLQLAENTELRNWFLSFDSRLTYKLSSTAAVFPPAVFYPQVTASAGNTGKLHLQGEGISPDMLGRSRFDYTIEVTDPGVVSIIHLTSLTGARRHDVEVELVNQLTPPIDLPLSGYTFRLTQLNLGNFWTVTGFLRPTGSLVEIEQTLRQIGEPNLLQLFGVDFREPFATFRNCWEKHPDFAYRLTGLVAAIIFRTEELRVG